MWRSSNIWELKEQIKMTLMTKLRADSIRVMFSTVLFRILYLPVSYLKIETNVVFACDTFSLVLKEEHRLEGG
jgi:hypothetical protein